MVPPRILCTVAALSLRPVGLCPDFSFDLSGPGIRRFLPTIDITNYYIYFFFRILYFLFVFFYAFYAYRYGDYCVRKNETNTHSSVIREEGYYAIINARKTSIRNIYYTPCFGRY